MHNARLELPRERSAQRAGADRKTGGAGYARAVTARLGRRAFLTGVGASAGWLLARGLGVSGWPGTAETAAGHAELLRALAASLTPRQRELLVLRPTTPRGRSRTRSRCSSARTSGPCSRPTSRPSPAISAPSMLSPQGRAAFAGTLAVEGRLEGCVLAIYGEPESESAQVVLWADT